MKTFKLLVGLPGSGKTHYGRGMGLPFFDDVTQNGGLDWLLSFSILSPTLDLDELTVVLSDHGFIFPKVREKVVYFLKSHYRNCKIEWLVWDNDPVTCWENIQRRNDGRVISKGALLADSRDYTYPSSPNFLVYSPKP